MPLIANLAKSAARWGVARKASGGGIVATGVAYLATRVATRSVPGALLVGGALAGKYLWDRHKERSGDNDAETTAEPAPEKARRAK